jgi:TatD DNase family protein
MDFLNIHTHHELPEGETTVLSVGLHPWHLTEDWMEKMPEIEQMLMKGDSFVGECGLDRVCETPYERQVAAFAEQITLSERLHRPLILHCVRALDDVLRLKRAASQIWVFHGFRGKPQQLRQLLDHGFYVSFGFRYNEESLMLCPIDRLFLETDDAPRSIVPLYESVARLRKISVVELQEQLWANLRNVMNRAER